MNKKVKQKKIILTTLICLFITIMITIGIGFYNYYGYIGYKKDFLDDYFDIDGTKKESNQTKIENAIRFTSNGYIVNPGNLNFYDLGIDGNEYNKITDKKLESGLNINAYIKDGTLHLPNYFDINLYALRNTIVAEKKEDNEDKMNYYFFVSNIQYKYLSSKYKDFDPKNLYINIFEGIDDNALKNASYFKNELKDPNDGDFIIGNACNIWSYTLTTEGDDAYASYALYDNNKDNATDNYQFPKIYRFNVSKGREVVTDDEGKKETLDKSFDSQKGITFVLYYYDLNRNISDVIVQGTYENEIVNGNILSIENIKNATNYQRGYNYNLNNAHYKTFIMPKIIKTSIIVFIVSLVFTGALGFIWTLEPKKVDEQNIVKKKKKN